MIFRVEWQSKFLNSQLRGIRRNLAPVAEGQEDLAEPQMWSVKILKSIIQLTGKQCSGSKIGLLRSLQLASAFFRGSKRWWNGMRLNHRSSSVFPKYSFLTVRSITVTAHCIYSSHCQISVKIFWPLCVSAKLLRTRCLTPVNTVLI